ncbi:MAG TPA: hypothetical protein VNB64_05645 [Solirubrobacteraceae bacterium]|nr:hypothetical protein [Solirubrobacteraceae bacterium]
MTFQGSNKTAGSLIHRGCQRVVDPNEDRTETFSAAGTASESTTFRALRPQRTQVTRTGGSYGAGAYRNFTVELRTSRSSTLEGYATPAGCYPTPPRQRPDCGGRTRRYQMQVRLVGRDFVVRFISRAFVFQSPDDPFTNCSLVQGQRWAGNEAPVRARVSGPRLFDRSVGRIVVGGRKSGTRGAGDAEVSSTSEYTARLTLVLVRL